MCPITTSGIPVQALLVSMSQSKSFNPLNHRSRLNHLFTLYKIKYCQQITNNMSQRYNYQSFSDGNSMMVRLAMLWVSNGSEKLDCASAFKRRLIKVPLYMGVEICLGRTVTTCTLLSAIM